MVYNVNSSENRLGNFYSSKATRLVVALSLMELRKGFRRNSLGILWSVPQHFVFIIGIAWLSHALFGGDFDDRLRFGSLGYLGFVLLSGPVLNSGQYLFRYPILDAPTWNWRNKVATALVCHFYEFFLAALILVPIATGSKILVNPLNFVAFLGLVIVSLPLVFGTACCLALLNLRFRDTEPIVNLLGRLWFLSLPVFWHEDLLADNVFASRALVTLNPYGGLIVEIRKSLLGQTVSLTSVTLILTAGICLLAVVALTNRHVTRTVSTLMTLR